MSTAELNTLNESDRAYLPHGVLRGLASQLYDKYGCQKNAAKTIGVHPSTFGLYYHGKQCSVLLKTLLTILRELGKEEVVLKRVEPFDEYMKRAVVRNHAKLKPPLVPFNSVVIEEGEEAAIDVLKLLKELKYVERLKRIDGVVRIKNIWVGTDVITLEYEVFNKRNSTYVKRALVLPHILSLNCEVMHFLGLWSGDRAGGGRVGIVNTEPELLRVTGELLQKYFKQPADSLIGYVMSVAKVSSEHLNPLHRAGVKEIKHVINPGCYGKLVFTVCVHNGPLKKLFDFLKCNLAEIFSLVGADERGSFYAGLFDAEGNVNAGRKGICFRWSTENPDFEKFLMTWLEKDGFMPKYDGANIKIGCRKETRKIEFQRFEELIIPHIHHPRKRHAAQELLKTWR